MIAGALGPRAKGEPPTASWYAAAERALTALGVPSATRARARFAGVAPQRAGRARSAAAAVAAGRRAAARTGRTRPAPEEARPPRPLAPSSLGDGRRRRSAADAGDARARPSAGGCSMRCSSGCPRLPPASARGGRRSLAGRAGRASPMRPCARRSLGRVLAVIEDPRFAELFGAGRARRSADRGGGRRRHGRAGTVDRLLVTPDRRPRDRFQDRAARARRRSTSVPAYHLRQMAAYAAALRVIFPGRAVEAALLYTAGAGAVRRCRRRCSTRTSPACARGAKLGRERLSAARRSP